MLHLWSSTGAALSAELDGLSLDHWHSLLEEWRKLDLPARVSLVNFARELGRGRESARTIGLAPAMAEVDGVIAFNQSKHPGSKWLTQTALYHLGKHHSHLGRALAGTWEDHETGRPHYAHAIGRLAMVFGLELRERERR